MPPTDTDLRTPVATGPEPGSPGDPDGRRAELLKLKEELAQSRRYSYLEHLDVLTDTFVEMQDQGRETNRRLGHVESDLAVVKTRVERIDSRVERIDSRVERIDSQVGEISSRVERIDSRVGEIDSRVERIDSRVGEIGSRVGEIGSRVERIDKQLGVVIDEVRATGARVERLAGYVIRDETGGGAAN